MSGPVPEDAYYALVTGANGGLGLAICCRLIDEFLATRPSTRSITLIFTTRSRQKGQDTELLIRKHLDTRCSRDELSCITLHGEIVDLTSLASIQELSDRLKSSFPKLDTITLNAGIGGFTGLNWPLAVWTVLTDWIHAVTWPIYKLSAVGSLTGRQLVGEVESSKDGNGSNSIAMEPPLGELFCANVFGHYMLVHWLSGLLSRSDLPGRIIWVSSVEAIQDAFSIHDIQSLKSITPYESTKRLTDLLALTAELPSTKHWVDRFLPAEPHSAQPEMYLMHPGICATSILPLAYVLQISMLIACYIARWIGSPWHTITAYSGACSAVWLALSPTEQLHRLERDGAKKHKWGSATDLWGNDRVTETDVEGWGYGGVVGEAGKGRRGRRRGAKDLTAEARVEFEDMGREAWRQMEELRVEWERRLAAGGSASRQVR